MCSRFHVLKWGLKCMALKYSYKPQQDIQSHYASFRSSSSNFLVCHCQDSGKWGFIVQVLKPRLELSLKFSPACQIRQTSSAHMLSLIPCMMHATAWPNINDLMSEQTPTLSTSCCSTTDSTPTDIWIPGRVATQTYSRQFLLWF